MDEDLEPAVSPHHKHHRRLKTVIVLLIILLVVGLGAVGYLIYSNFQHKKTTTTTTASTQPAVVQPATATINGTVKNKISNDPIVGATITVGSQKTFSAADGSFNLTIEAGTTLADATVSASGYVSGQVAPKDGMVANLVPEGRVIFLSNKDGGKRGIYSINYDGTDEKALVARVADKEDYEIAISPHDRYVAFLSTRDGRKNKYGSDEPSLYLVKIDGSGLTKISDFYGIYSVTWSPDGKYLGWYGREKDTDNNSKVAVRDIDKGTTVYNGTSVDNINYFAFAKDDSQLAFTIYSNDNSQRTGIYVANGDGNNPKKISDLDEGASFNKDGNLEFNVYQGATQKYYTWFHDSGVVKETVKPDTSNVRQGTTSPDGALVAYIDSRDGKSNVFVSKPDKSGEKQLTNIDDATGSPRFTQDGKYLVFDAYKTGESAKYIVAVSGSNSAQKVTDELYQNYGGEGE